MASTTVKLSQEARAGLAELAAVRKQPMSEVVADLIKKERQRQFFEEFNASFARLKADPAAWADWQAELKSMEGTLMDGLEDDPWVE